MPLPDIDVYVQSRDKTETIRMNISMERKEKEEMKTIATEHYGGNISQLIRAAVNTKEQQLNGLGLAELKKMRSTVDSLEERVDAVHEMVDELSTLTSGIGAGIEQSNSTNNALNDRKEVNESRIDNHRLAVEIMDVIKDDQPLMMETIVSKVDNDLHSIYQKTGELVDRGVVTCINQNSDNPLYKLSEAMI